MVRAGAYDGKAERDIDRIVEVEKFERDQALVVIHRNNRIESSACSIAKDGIGHAGTGKLGDLQLVEGLDRRSNDPLFFVTKLTVFTGMRVESGDSDSWAADATLLKKFGRERADIEDRIHSDQIRNACERFVNGCQAYRQMLAGKKHAEARYTKGVSKELRLTRKLETNGFELMFADGARDHRGGSAVLEFSHCGCKTLKRSSGRLRIGSPRGGSAAFADDFEIVSLRELARGKSEIDDFRPNAGGVAKGDEDACHASRIPAMEPSAKWQSVGICISWLAGQGVARLQVH